MSWRTKLRGRLPATGGRVASVQRGLTEVRAEVREARSAHHDELRTSFDRLAAQVDALVAGQLQLREGVRAAIDDDAGTRARLADLRASPDYEQAYREDDPLVSIVMPTYDNVRGLVERSVPSALGQTYENIELIVVGDAAAPETGEALAAIDDGRLHFENLLHRGPYAEDRKALWYTAGTPPLNRAMALARGRWIAVLNDDDAYRPDFVERLLAHARATRAEVAYGRQLHREPSGEDWEIGVFPPENHAFGWQSALQHAGLRLYGFEFHAPVFDEPGDWHRAQRMLRTGVRFSMLDAVVGDYWPSTLWRGSRL